MGYLYYKIADKAVKSQYPTWKDSTPNLQTFLNAINKSQPISNSQFELVWSRWPRTIFFAKNITIPGVQVNTLDLNHSGFTMQIPTHVTYENTEINMTIMADKEGYHYYDIRNMVMQTGHPLVAGDTMAFVGTSWENSGDTLDISLRNNPNDKAYHHWQIINFRPTQLGDLELSHDGGQFVEFEVTGIFTHIKYYSGAPSGSKGGSSGSGSGFSVSGGSSSAKTGTEAGRPQPAPITATTTTITKPEEEEATEQESANSENQGTETQQNEDEPTPIYNDTQTSSEIVMPVQESEDSDKQWNTVIDSAQSYPQVKDKAEMATASAEIDNDNCQLSASILSNVQVNGMENINQGNVTAQELSFAEQCNEKLNGINEELRQSLQKIGEMPADSSFEPVEVNDQGMVFKNTAKYGQTDEAGQDRAETTYNITGTLRSQAQQEAYEAAINRYKRRASNIMENYNTVKTQYGQSQVIPDF